MLNEQCWIIKNQNGYYVNAKYGSLYNGIATGFTFYINKELADKDLKMLGKGFKLEYINLKDIPEGKRIFIN